MKAWKALSLLCVCLLCMVLPAMDSAPPRAVVTGPEACALCGFCPAYCVQCWIYLLWDVWNLDTLIVY